MRYTTLINTDDNVENGSFTEGQEYIAQDNFIVNDDEDENIYVNPHQYETRDDNNEFIGRLDVDKFKVVESHYAYFEELGKK